MGLKDFFSKKEPLIAIDVGASSIKLIEVEWDDERPRLVHYGLVPSAPELFSGQSIAKREKAAELIRQLLEQVDGTDKRICACVPAPAAFCKRVSMNRMSPTELANSIQFEAASAIPHNIDAVHLDYQVLRPAGKSQMEVLVVAVKNEVVESYLETFSLAEVEVAVLDVDHFAVQNAFELAHPELQDKSIALIHIGHRYSAINMVRGGLSLVNGDISSSGKTVNDALIQGLGLSASQADELKRKGERAQAEGLHDALAVVSKQVDNIAAELNRQLSMLWGAADTEGGIDAIVLSGGSSKLIGLAEAVQTRTGIETKILDPLIGLDISPELDVEAIAPYSSTFSTAVGLALRQAGDRYFPEFDND